MCVLIKFGLKVHPFLARDINEAVINRIYGIPNHHEFPNLARDSVTEIS